MNKFKSQYIRYLFFYLIVLSDSLYSQYLIDRWTTAQGLPQNSVNTIIQTRDGYLWLGTYGGLVRFDGLNFTKIGDEASGLQSDRILSLYESYDGCIWIGTESRGLVKYLNGSFISYEKDDYDFTGIFSLVECSDSMLWIGTQKGVRWLRNGRVDSSLFGYSVTSSVRSIKRTNNKEIWIYTLDGVYKFSNKKLEKVTYVGTVNKQKVLNFLLEDSDKSLWFFGLNKLVQYSNGKIEVISLDKINPSVYIDKMMQDSDGIYWAGGLSTGILSINLSDKKITNHPLLDGKSNSKVQTLFIDADGNRWFGMDGDGLVQIKDRVIDVIGPEEGLNHTIVEAVFEDSKQRLWIGTNDGGLYTGVKERLRQFKIPNIDYLSIWSLTEDKQGAIWAGTYGGGVWRIKNNKIKLYTTKEGLTWDGVLALYCDRDGVVWMGTERGGITLYKDGKFSSITDKEGLSNSSVRVFHQDKTGAIWIGTLNGLNKYQNGKIKVYKIKDGLSNNYVRSIYEDEDGVLWFGTYGGGLNRYKDGIFTKITTREGLFDNVVSAILEDDRKNFWMSCNRGIYTVARQELNDFADGKIKSINCIAYNTSDGLLSEETNGGFQPAGWKTKDGHLLFPTIKGLAVIHPEKIKTNPIPPKVHIEKILINQNQIPITSLIEVPSGKHQIEINFSALNYSAPRNIAFRYKLIGIQNEWINIGNRREVYFFNLAPGEYKFYVTASNNYGVWNEKGEAVLFVVEPPFWSRWYFLSALILFLVSFVFILICRRERKRQYEMNVHQKFTHKLLDSMEAERKRIATELHDSIGQELLIIKNRAQLALNDINKKKELKEQLEEISETATRAINETREISYNLRPYQIDRLGLTKAIESIINRASGITNVAFTTDIDRVDDAIDKEMEIHLYRIVQECINNIIKHSSATRCNVAIKKWYDRINIDIEDDGKGFELKTEDQSPQGFGMQGITERVQFLGGKYRIESRPDKGTRILLTFKTYGSKNDNK